MGRCTIVVLLATFLSLGVCAQTPDARPAAEQPSSASTSATPSTSRTSTEAPWDKFRNFSALMTGGPIPGTADEIHIYRSGDLLRMEGPDRNSYIVQDLTKQGDTRVMSRVDCLQMGVPFARSYPFFFSSKGNTYEYVSRGAETIEGHPTKIEEVTINFGPEKKRGPLKLKVWEAEDLQGFPIKVETQNHRTMEYRSVNFGPLDVTLFITSKVCEPLEATKSKNKGSTQSKKAPASKPE